MNIQKELSELALDLTEEQYRNSEELHYSTISRFEERGFSGLDHLFDKIESPSLTLGQLVDVMLTGGQEEFDRQFIVADLPSIGEKEQQIADKLYDMCHNIYSTFSLIPDRAILEAADEFEYQKRFKPETKIEKLTEACSAYYNLKVQAGDKQVVSQKVYEDAAAMVIAFKESPNTSGYFAEDDIFSPVRRYYQLKFKATIEGVAYIVMLDEIVVNYDKKIIYPCDIKTSGMPEWEFETAFMKYHYYQQSRLYWAVLKANLMADEYFKDFELRDFRFLVVNKQTLTPLVWEFPLTRCMDTLVSDRGTEVRSPLDLGKELKGYLDLRPQVPNGINIEGINIINCLKIKEDVQ